MSTTRAFEIRQDHHSVNYKNLFQDYFRLNNLNENFINLINDKLNKIASDQETLKDYMKTWLKLFDEISRSTVVIAACKRDQYAMFYYPVSPFFQHVIELLQTKGHITPKKLYQYIQTKNDPDMDTLQIISSSERQDVNQPVRYGKHADEIDLCPVIKPY
ncbi:unnamed protein product [Didymodactylos carnosus]|uniref:Uncharacterized protein n=1 Tax=Didymodactylos carnosus TaxID=1234261 RepID=A0A8S2RF85_9BILA|nr:unnamed protein product [Didymodactylos carnosus]CAF4163559.1 unnamed protein product [Didymodactylos carnosus]